MKKLLCILALPLLSTTTFATEVTLTTIPATLPATLITYADQALAKGTTTVDKLLTAMQTIHESQKAEITSALEKGNTTSAQKTLSQRSEMYPLTTHLYGLKAGSGATLTNASGVVYTFKKQSPLPRINLSRGDEEFYSFPKHDTFLELQWNLAQTGTLYNEISITTGSETYLPHYFYGGDNTLQDLSRKDEGRSIMELREEKSDVYFFFDLPASTLENNNFSLTLTSGGRVAGSDIYNAKSYSPEYFLTSLDKGFQFCQKVATFIGTAATKEYSATQCSDAANGKFSKEMHADILNYAADFYL